MEDEPAYEIAITHVRDDVHLNADCLAKAIEAVLSRHRTPSARLSIALVDDDEIARLNRLHLDHEGPTDVLAFDLRDADRTGERGVSCGRLSVDGEVVLSVDTAARQAAARGHSLEAELALYAVHGTLHLLGYNDTCKHEAAKMHAVEDEVLSAVGFGAVYGVGTG